MARKPDNRYIRYYTVGSAARELAPQAPVHPQPTPKPRKAKRITFYIDPVAILGIVTAVFMMICLLVGLVKLQEARAQQTVMADYVHTLTTQNAELTTQFHDKLDLQQIESAALELGMVPAEQVSQVCIQVSAD